MIPVTVAKIMVPMSGTKIAQDSQSPWLTTARIKNSTDTPTMRFARTSSILWPALATTAAMIAAAPKAADPTIWSTAIRAPEASSPGSSTGSRWRCRSRAIRYRMGTVEHRLRALVTICGTCPMLMPCAVQMRLTTSIARHAVSDSPSTQPVRRSRSTCGRPRIVPDTVPAQPMTSTADTDNLHDTNPPQDKPPTRTAGHRVNSLCPAAAEDFSPLCDTNRTGTGLSTRT